jgi:hypothetical protein
VSATGPGKLIVVQAVSTSTGSTGLTVDFLTTILGQPPWQHRASMHGTQPGCAVSLETWYFVSSSAFDPVTVGVHYLPGGGIMAWEVLCLEYGNVDPDTPWDDDPSVPAVTQNNSIVFSTTPNITGLATAHDYCLQVGYYGANTSAQPIAGTGFTLDASENIIAASHTSATAEEESKPVHSRSSGLSVGMGTGASSWCFIADTIRGTNTPRTAMTQVLNATSHPAVKTFDQTLFGIAQEIDVMSNPGAHIATTLPTFVQRADIAVSPVVSIAQTLPVLKIGGNFVVNNPDGSIFGQTHQTLPTLTQLFNGTVSANGDIAQTLPGFIQEFDANHSVPNVTSDIAAELHGFTQVLNASLSPASEITTLLKPLTVDFPLHVIVDNPTGTGLCVIDQTFPGMTQMEVVVVSVGGTGIDTILPGIQQRADVIEEIPAFIDTTLFQLVPTLHGEIVGDIDQTLQGFGQADEEIDVIVEIPAIIDQTLRGFSQEIDVEVPVVATADQVLNGLMQEIDVHVANPTVTVAGHADQTFESLTQRIIVDVSPNADIACELRGLQLHAKVKTRTHGKHDRAPSAIPMPSKDMPVHHGELEFFRGKVYGRAVDAMVPPQFIAEHNLTTRQYPNARSPVNRTPLGKPKS